MNETGDHVYHQHNVVDTTIHHETPSINHGIPDNDIAVIETLTDENTPGIIRIRNVFFTDTVEHINTNLIEQRDISTTKDIEIVTPVGNTISFNKLVLIYRDSSLFIVNYFQFILYIFSSPINSISR